MTKSAVQRAEDILNRWGRPTASMPQDKAAMRPQSPAGSEDDARPVARAEALLDGAGRKSSGQGALQTVARGYVAMALSVQKRADAFKRNWQKAVQQARREQEEKAAQTEGPKAARNVAREERRGEKTLNKLVGVTKQVAEEAAEGAAETAA